MRDNLIVGGFVLVYSLATAYTMGMFGWIRKVMSPYKYRGRHRGRYQPSAHWSHYACTPYGICTLSGVTTLKLTPAADRTEPYFTVEGQLLPAATEEWLDFEEDGEVAENIDLQAYWKQTHNAEGEECISLPPWESVFEPLDNWGRDNWWSEGDVNESTQADEFPTTPLQFTSVVNTEGDIVSRLPYGITSVVLPGERVVKPPADIDGLGMDADSYRRGFEKGIEAVFQGKVQRAADAFAEADVVQQWSAPPGYAAPEPYGD